MSLRQALADLSSAGTLTCVPTNAGHLYGWDTFLGAHHGQSYTVSGTILVFEAGGHRARAEVWTGGVQVLRPPLEANWPAVKALREIRAGEGGEDVVLRLLRALFQEVK